MSGFVTFVLMVTGMGVGTLVCGLAPLSLPLSHRMMRVLEVFGAGLLVGAAVTVVIPEGASSLFSNLTPATQANVNVYANMLHPSGAVKPFVPLQAHPASIEPADESWAWSFITKRSQDPTHDPEHEHDHEHHDPKRFSQTDAEHRLGSSILFGIVLMYIIDQLTSTSGTSSPAQSDKTQHAGSSNHTHGHDQPARPRLETHRLSKSFHHKPDPTAMPNAIHKTSSRASFTIFDRSQHGIAGMDEEAQVGPANAETASIRNEPHRRIESVATASSSNSEQDLPDDYDDHNPEHYHHADLKRVSSTHGANNEWYSSPRSSTTLNRDAPAHESSSPGAPLLYRHESSNSLGNGQSRPRRSRSMSSTQAATTSTFGQALTTILGLLIHAAADGIAMGASAQSGDQTLTMVVFVAIMVHKAPAAFGLCAMLMSQRLSRTSIRKAVGVFALASPLGAILTYLLLALFFDADVASAHGAAAAADAQGVDGKSIGTALAFSGGTFLFVAFHAVLELAGADADTVPKLTAGDEGGEVQILGKWLRIVLLIAGSCTPRLLQSLLAALGAGEGHHH